MQMIKIHIPDQQECAKGIYEVARRGRVICFQDNVFIVPEPALQLLGDLGVTFVELGRGGFDYAEKVLRDSPASEVQRRATG